MFGELPIFVATERVEMLYGRPDFSRTITLDACSGKRVHSWWKPWYNSIALYIYVYIYLSLEEIPPIKAFVRFPIHCSSIPKHEEVVLGDG